MQNISNMNRLSAIGANGNNSHINIVDKSCYQTEYAAREVGITCEAPSPNLDRTTECVTTDQSPISEKNRIKEYVPQSKRPLPQYFTSKYDYYNLDAETRNHKQTPPILQPGEVKTAAEMKEHSKHDFDIISNFPVDKLGRQILKK